MAAARPTSTLSPESNSALESSQAWWLIRCSVGRLFLIWQRCWVHHWAHSSSAVPGSPGSLGAGAANRAEGWAQICGVTRAILDGGEVRERQPRSNWPVSILPWRRSPASHCGNEKTLFLKRYFQLGQLLFIFPLLPLVGSGNCCHQNNNRVRFMNAWLVLFISTLSARGQSRSLQMWLPLKHPSDPYILALVSCGWSMESVNMFTESLLPSPGMYFFNISFLCALHPISLLNLTPPWLSMCPSPGFRALPWLFQAAIPQINTSIVCTGSPGWSRPGWCIKYLLILRV